MAYKYLDETGLAYFWGKLKAYFQPTLVSGTNIKTINNETLLGSGDIALPSPTDYIVDQGTSGGWFYRKWNSGICESWYSGTTTVTPSPLGSVYRAAQLSLNLPSGLYSGTPLYAYGNVNSKQAGYFACNVSADSSTALGMQIFSAISGSNIVVPICVYVNGRWK